MQMVTFTRDMRPYHRGQSVPLPDDVARKMVEDGAADDLRPWPPVQHAAAVETQPPKRGPGRPSKLFLTKG